MMTSKNINCLFACDMWNCSSVRIEIEAKYLQTIEVHESSIGDVQMGYVVEH